MALLDNILAYWNLNDDGSGGVSLTDSTGNGYTLTAPNGTSGLSLGTGIIAGDASFNGTGNTYLHAGFSPTGDTFSVSCWAKIYNGNAIISGDIFNGAFGFDIAFTDAITSKPRFLVGTSNGYEFATANLEVADGNWHHFVGTYNRGGSLSLYIDGSKVAQKAATGDAPNSCDNGFGINGDSGGEYGTGGQLQVDEVGLWSRELSPTEVYNLYYSGTGNTYPFSNSPIPLPLSSSCKAYWNLDDNGSGAVSLADSTDNGYTLYVDGTAPALGTGVIAGDAVFDNANYGNLLNDSIDLSGIRSFSMSGWFNTSGSAYDWHALGNWYPSGFGDYQTIFYFINGFVRFQINFGVDISSLAEINDGNWHFLVGTYDGSTASFYIDGVLQGSSSYSDPLVASTGWGIGNATYSQNSGNTYNGSIDEVGLWNRALSAEDVTALYNGGNGLTYPFVGLYFNGAIDNDWGNLGNWWKDSSFTTPATSLPDSSSYVYIYADVLENTDGDGVCYCKAAEFYSASFYSPLVLNTSGLVNFNGTGGVFDGTATDGISFHDTCSLGENGFVTGNAMFRDSSTNSFGTVNGNAVFHEASYNYGQINGNAEVYYDGGSGTYPIGGVVDGSVSYFGWPANQDQYFNDDVSGSGAAGNWEDKNNWWADDSFTTRPINSVGTQELPDAGTNIYLYAAIYAYNTISAINVNRARFYGSAYLNTPITLNVSVNVYFYNSSGNQSHIYGDCYFYDNSYFYTNTGAGFVTGNVYLYNNSGIYEDARTGANLASGGLYFYSLDAMKNTISYHFGGESDGTVFNIPSEGSSMISRLLNLPWFINI